MGTWAVADVDSRTDAETRSFDFKRLTMSSNSAGAGIAPRFSFRTPIEPPGPRGKQKYPMTQMDTTPITPRLRHTPES